MKLALTITLVYDTDDFIEPFNVPLITRHLESCESLRKLNDDRVENMTVTVIGVLENPDG